MAALPQPPPMAYSPHPETAWPGTSAHGQSAPYSAPGRSNGPSPFSPATTFVPNSPSYKSNPSLDSNALGKALSDTSSGPSSPSRSSYNAAIHRPIRESYNSNRSSNSHRSNLASPNPLNAPRDLEKQQIHSPRHIPSSRTKSRGYETSYGQDRGDEEEVILEHKALKILIYLSTFNPFVTITILLYTIFALFATILLQPFRLCAHASPLSTQIIAFLSPALKIQLAFIYAGTDIDTYNAPLLVVVLLLSPLVSMGVAVAAWVAAAFWFFNAILGDPDGSDKPKGYNDGRASVIGVRKWWERWLVRALKT